MLIEKLLGVCLGATLLLSLTSCGISSAQEREKQRALVNYRVSVGDELSIEVYGHPELSSKRVVVDRKGKITVPSVKAVKVSGLSLVEMVALLHRKLESLAPKLQIHVSVLSSPSLGSPPAWLPSPDLRDAPARGNYVAQVPPH